MTTPPPPSAPREIPLIERLRASTAGRYVIHAELGVGGMATVFRATEIALEREVAIKVMSTEMASSSGAFERFRREARVAAALSHPHIVPIYAIGEDPTLAWFAMKFIDGRGLDAILRSEGARTVEAVAQTIGVVGKALHYAHERGVVHRDVKPANIMVGNDGWTYVTDFGIAKRDDAQGLTQAGTVIGTPAYMSPEQFNGQAITGAADQYSLGIVAFEMLTGRAPFDGPSLGEVMRGHLLDPVPPLRTMRIDVPIAVASAVNRMLEKDASQRFATLAEAVAALEAGASTARGGVRPVIAVQTSVSPTTPIPRSSGMVAAGSTSGAPSAGAASRPSTAERNRPTSAERARPITAERARPEPPAASGTPILLTLLVLAVAGAGSWYAFRDRIASLLGTTTVAATPVAIDTTPVAPAALPVETAAVDTAPPDTGASTADSAATQRAIDSAIAVLSARVAAAPVIDLYAPDDSVIIRVGSDVRETVLFVNGNQVGIIGGRGLMETPAVPGPVTISIRKLNCRDWDTTFTGLAGRRYTLVGRAPAC